MSKIRNRAAGKNLAYDKLLKLLASSGSLNNLQIKELLNDDASLAVMFGLPKNVWQ